MGEQGEEIIKTVDIFMRNGYNRNMGDTGMHIGIRIICDENREGY